MGFDAFGIHSENYALKVGTNPNDLIPRNVANFTRQLKRVGGMFDWNHTVDTTAPEYYKWTQWIFLKLFHGGLVERRDGAVNWCPSCKTVLANEQVIAGLCERCDSVVEQRRLPQWYFKISQYAGRLLDNIDRLDWSETTRKAQANWIGRSDGAEVDFAIAGTDVSVRVFTTRPDTLFGATYMVLAPEHPLVDVVTTSAQRSGVDRYRDDVAKRDLVDRKKADKDKSGVFTGGYCINPVNAARIPIWIADYVLMDYGTGAIMAVPGHDQRDFEFAQRFDLPIVRVVAAAGDTATTPLDGRVRRRRRARQLGPIRRRQRRRRQTRHCRMVGRARCRGSEGQLSFARLVRIAAALLGSADSDHLLRNTRRGAGARGRLAGVAAARRRFQAR